MKEQASHGISGRTVIPIPLPTGEVVPVTIDYVRGDHGVEVLDCAIEPDRLMGLTVNQVMWACRIAVSAMRQAE